MHAVKLRRQAQICPVVHDQPRVSHVSDRVPQFSPILREVGVWSGRVRKAPLQFPRLLQHHPRIPRFVAVLQKRASSGHELGCEPDDLFNG